MAPWWCEFDGRPSACVDASTADDARAEAERLTGFRVTRVDSLPYPANPRLNGQGWALCFAPTECRGRGACPRRISCTS